MPDVDSSIDDDIFSEARVLGDLALDDLPITILALVLRGTELRCSLSVCKTWRDTLWGSPDWSAWLYSDMLERGKGHHSILLKSCGSLPATLQRRGLDLDELLAKALIGDTLDKKDEDEEVDDEDKEKEDESTLSSGLATLVENERLEGVRMILGFRHVNGRLASIPESIGNSLLVAAKHGHHGLVDFLILKGPLGPEGVDLDDTDAAAAMSSALHAAAESVKRKYGDKHLTIAASNKDEGAVLALVITGYEDLEIKDKGGFTALALAANRGLKSSVQALVDAGADKDSQTLGGDTPLIMAANNGHKECLEILLNAAGAKTSEAMAARDMWGNTALICAARNGRKECLVILLDAGADKNAVGKVGCTALMLAAWGGHEACARVLVESGADKNIRDNCGKSAHDWAKTDAINDLIGSLDIV